MLLCVDRIEGDTVLLLDESERPYPLSRAEYAAMVGKAPAESDMLQAEVQSGAILSAVYDKAETESRKEAARARLNRLFGRK
jgi:hypothetical protein